MTRVSERISQRINATLSTLECPECGKTITPRGVIVAVAVLSVLMGLAGIIVGDRHAIELSSPDSA